MIVPQPSMDLAIADYATELTNELQQLISRMIERRDAQAMAQQEQESDLQRVGQLLREVESKSLYLHVEISGRKVRSWREYWQLIGLPALGDDVCRSLEYQRRYIGYLTNVVPYTAQDQIGVTNLMQLGRLAKHAPKQLNERKDYYIERARKASCKEFEKEVSRQIDAERKGAALSPEEARAVVRSFRFSEKQWAEVDRVRKRLGDDVGISQFISLATAALEADLATEKQIGPTELLETIHRYVQFLVDRADEEDKQAFVELVALAVDSLPHFGNDTSVSVQLVKSAAQLFRKMHSDVVGQFLDNWQRINTRGANETTDQEAVD